MCSGSSMGVVLTAQDREVLLALSHRPAGELTQLSELIDQTEGSIAAGKFLMSLRTLVGAGLAQQSDIGWRWGITEAGSQFCQQLIQEAMNAKGEGEERQI